MSRQLPLFVYGTLMRGRQQEGLLAGLARRTAQVRGSLWDLPAGYPALRLDGSGLVYGELVNPPGERRLALLDHYEGVPEGLYQRVAVEAVVGLRPEPAWAWVMDHPERRGGRAIPEGRWRAIRRR